MLLLFEWAQGRRVLGEGEEFHTHYIAKILTRDLNGQITYIAKKGFSVSYCRSNSFKAGYKNCSEMASSSWDSRISVSAGAEITDFYVVNVSCRQSFVGWFREGFVVVIVVVLLLLLLSMST